VGGVAGEQDAALLPAVRRGGVKLVDGRAPDLVVLRRQPRTQQLLDLLGTHHLLAGLAFDQLELPAAVRILHAHVGGEPRGIAYLHRRQREVGIGPLEDVHHEPVLVVAEAQPLDPHRAAHEARGTVAAEHEGGPHSLRRLRVRGAASQRDAVVVLLDRLHLVAHPHLDALVGRDLLAQQGFELGLVEEGDVAPAVHAVLRKLEPEERIALRVREEDPILLAGRLEDGAHRLPEPDPLAGAHGFAVQPHGPRQHDGLGGALEDHHPKPGLGEQQARKGTDGPEAHDGDVEVLLAHAPSRATRRAGSAALAARSRCVPWAMVGWG
jgi:hypothetical protein